MSTTTLGHPPLTPDAVDDIRHFLPAIREEIAALMQTRCPHDRQRALKALRHLECLVATLKHDVEAFPTGEPGPTLVIDNEPGR